MPTIDADAHVIESEQTWDYIEDDKFKPFLVTPGGRRPQNWLIDGRVFNRGVNVDRGLTEEIREMRDIDGRLEHMDELNIDVQVLYPSLFLRPLTDKPEVEIAICQKLQPVAHRYLQQGKRAASLDRCGSDDRYRRVL